MNYMQLCPMNDTNARRMRLRLWRLGPLSFSSLAPRRYRSTDSIRRRTGDSSVPIPSRRQVARVSGGSETAQRRLLVRLLTAWCLPTGVCIIPKEVISPRIPHDSSNETVRGPLQRRNHPITPGQRESRPMAPPRLRAMRAAGGGASGPWTLDARTALALGSTARAGKIERHRCSGSADNDGNPIPGGSLGWLPGSRTSR